ncbi:MAG TPA: Ig-like domain-containing protein [Patescibacteria group bacterium]
MKKLFILLSLMALSAVVGCKDKDRQPFPFPMETESGQMVATVQIVGPNTVNVDETIQLLALGDGHVHLTTGDWSVDNDQLAVVLADGRVVGLKTGSVEITYTFGSLTESQTITVKGAAKQAASLTISPAAVTLEETDLVNFRVLANNTDGSTSDVTYRATYASDNEEFFTVDRWGQGVARKMGNAQLTVELTNPDNSKVTRMVSVVVIKLQKTLDDLMILAAGDRLDADDDVSLEVLAGFDDGSSAFIYDVSWNFDSTLVDISPMNVMSVKGNGTFVLTAARDGKISQDVTVNTTVPPQKLTLSVAANDPLGVNGTVQLGLTNSQPISTLDWVITPSTAGSVNSSKVFKALEAGRVRVKARTDGGNPAESNEIEIVVLGNRGIIAGMYYCKKAEADQVFGNQAGETYVISNQNGWSPQQVVVQSVSGQDYYILQATIAAGTDVQWNLQRGNPGLSWYPNDTTASAPDVVDNGVGGKKFVHTAQ